MNRKAKIALVALALAGGVSTASAQTLVWSDTDFTSGWDATGWPGTLQSVNGQLVVTLSPLIPAQTNNPAATHVPGVHALPSFGALPDQQTLELRADLVSANQNDAVAAIALNWEAPALGSGYMFFKDDDEIALLKFYNGAKSFAYFFYTNQPIANQNVTLMLALTRRGSNVDITTQVLDKQNANAVLFARTVMDTPQTDPVLPNRAVRGFSGTSDPPGNPWPLLGSPAFVELTLSWFNSQQAPNPRAQVIYDNLELRQYASPQLTIQDAVVISWPVTTAKFVLESAPSLSGSWTPVADPWVRTNNGVCEVSVTTTDSARFFRLRFVP